MQIIEALSFSSVNRIHLPLNISDDTYIIGEKITITAQQVVGLATSFHPSHLMKYRYGNYQELNATVSSKNKFYVNFIISFLQ